MPCAMLRNANNVSRSLSRSGSTRTLPQRCGHAVVHGGTSAGLCTILELPRNVKVQTTGFSPFHAVAAPSTPATAPPAWSCCRNSRSKSPERPLCIIGSGSNLGNVGASTEFAVAVAVAAVAAVGASAAVAADGAAGFSACSAACSRVGHGDVRARRRHVRARRRQRTSTGWSIAAASGATAGAGAAGPALSTGQRMSSSRDRTCARWVAGASAAK